MTQLILIPGPLTSSTKLQRPHSNGTNQALRHGPGSSTGTCGWLGFSPASELIRAIQQPEQNGSPGSNTCFVHGTPELPPREGRVRKPTDTTSRRLSRTSRPRSAGSRRESIKAAVQGQTQRSSWQHRSAEMNRKWKATGTDNAPKSQISNEAKADGHPALMRSQSAALSRRSLVETRCGGRSNSPVKRNVRNACTNGFASLDSPHCNPQLLEKNQAKHRNVGELESIEMSLRSRRLSKQDMVASFVQKSTNNLATGRERVFSFNGPDEHIRQALLRRAPRWFENRLPGSALWDFKWSVTDCERDYKNLEEGDLYNHFQNNRELTTKVGLAKSLQRFAVEEGINVDSFFPRCYDLSVASEWEDFVLDFRRCAALNVALQHRRLSELKSSTHTGYICSVTVLSAASRALHYWLQDLDGSHLLEEEEERTSRLFISTQNWDALALYSELTDSQLCHVDDGEQSRRERNRGYSASGSLLQRGSGASTRPRATLRPSDVRSWPEFSDHVWVAAAPMMLESSLKKALDAIEVVWPQIGIHGSRNIWIVKPGTSSKGSGVECMNSLPEVLHHCKTVTNRIVQKYIERPLLLFSGRKFDIRQWVLVRSFKPLDAYMFSACYLRLCNQPYDAGDLSNRQRHISNWAVNKHGKHPVQGSVASLDDLKKTLGDVSGNRAYWEGHLQPLIKEIIKKCLSAVQDRVVQRTSCFELYGFDFLINEDLQPWLLEVNLSPACEDRTSWLSAMLDRMASRLLELVVDGDWKPDGQEPDWVPIDGTVDHASGQCEAQGASALSVNSSHAEYGQNVEGSKAGLGHFANWSAADLVVVGKSLNVPAERRFEEAWRRRAAQSVLVRAARRFLVRLRQWRSHQTLVVVRIQRWTRSWLLKSLLDHRVRNRAVLIVQQVARRYEARLSVNRVAWEARAICLQRRRRGVLGRRCAFELRQSLSAKRIAACVRSWIVRRVLHASLRLIRWWRRKHWLRIACACRIQKTWRAWHGRRCFWRLWWRLYSPTRRLALILAFARLRRHVVSCAAHEAAQTLQAVWRGLQCRRECSRRQACLEVFRIWSAYFANVTQAAKRLQSRWRGCAVRRWWLRILAVCKFIQRVWRLRLASRRCRDARREIRAKRIQRFYRARLQYAGLIVKVTHIQAVWRSWQVRNLALYQRRALERKRKWLAVASQRVRSPFTKLAALAACSSRHENQEHKGRVTVDSSCSRENRAVGLEHAALEKRADREDHASAVHSGRQRLDHEHGADAASLAERAASDFLGHGDHSVALSCIAETDVVSHRTDDKPNNLMEQEQGERNGVMYPDADNADDRNEKSRAGVSALDFDYRAQSASERHGMMCDEEEIIGSSGLHAVPDRQHCGSALQVARQLRSCRAVKTKPMAILGTSGVAFPDRSRFPPRKSGAYSHEATTTVAQRGRAIPGAL